LVPSPVVRVQLAVVPNATSAPHVDPSFENRIWEGAGPDALAMLRVTIVVLV
jgi:hypothetical protein